MIKLLFIYLVLRKSSDGLFSFVNGIFRYYICIFYRIPSPYGLLMNLKKNILKYQLISDIS